VKQRIGLQVAAPALAIGFALLVSGMILVATGYSPGEVLKVIVEDGFERARLVETINRAGPYYIAGVAVAVGFKMNLFNIGVEGQYKVAALMAAWAGASVSLPAVLHIPFVLLVATLSGAAWALIPAVLKVTRGVSEVISSIMLNSIAFGFTAFMLERFFRAPRGEYPGTVGTVPLDDSARLPSLNGILESIGIDLPSASRLQSFILVAALVGVAYHVIIWRTRFGYDLRASGSNAEAAEASGVDAKRMIVTALLLSGGIAGLIGLNNIMGDAGRYTDVSVIAGLGFTGIAVALLGRNHPVGIAFAALLWAFMDALQTPLSNNDLPKQITAILQGVTVLSVVIAYEVVRRIGLRQEAAHLRRTFDETEPDAGPGGGSQPEVVPA
jgi:simple sugar transport system permease protein